MNSAIRLFIAFLTMSAISCNLLREEDVVPIPGTFRVESSLTWGNAPYTLGQVVTDHLGHPLRLDNLQAYVAPIALRNAAGEWMESDDVFLLDFSNHNQKMVSTFPAGTYDAVRFGLGIPPEINTDMDPAAYPNDHPLSVLGSAGMFWTWASGYIFVKYEGKYALEPGSQLLEPISYHCGTDASYRTVTFELNEPVEVKSQEVTPALLTLDASRALIGTGDSIDIAVDPVTHNANGDSLGARMMDLLVDAWTLEFTE